ncbi:hypothetical protein DH2020_031208 [Rehmannia glutinosa]|uniref:Inositol polyphosphate-related phosphatase domain-containing protein n=1 Tax=Rehmannia glutinosa TaxID=99300 RepID=A0ABR0VKX6_REHGL
MKDGNSKKSKLSWPKTLVKKWFNLQSKSGDFHGDDIIHEGGDEVWRNNFSEREACNIKKTKTEKSNRRNHDRVQRNKIDPDSSQARDVHNYRFQEIVPLNAGNVLGTEDNGPARKWQSLIRKTLNNLPRSSGICLDDEFEGSNRKQDSSFSHRHSFRTSHSMRMMDSGIMMPHPTLDHRFSLCDRAIYGHRPGDYYCYDPYTKLDGCSSDDEDGISDSPVSYSHSISIFDRDRHHGQSRYFLVASKQMVGLFLMVWIRSDLRDAVRNLNVSCVGRGLMGYLGNKGSISISMSLYQTSFCFVCSHLTSGEKDGDELRRNSDVMEILRKTRFPQVHAMGMRIRLKRSSIMIESYGSGLELQNISFLPMRKGSCRDAQLESFLRIEQRHGRVFPGWNEGRIYFPPTYKYSNNSDRYAGENMHPKEKRRTPAWCDRILWLGHGLQQLSYVRGESRFSDHRPVYSLFLAEVESINCSRIKKSTSHSSSRVEVEELLPQYSHGYDELETEIDKLIFDIAIHIRFQKCSSKFFDPYLGIGKTNT